MAKRIFLGLVIAAFAAGGAFAQSNISFGVGTFFTSDFGGGFEFDEVEAGEATTVLVRTPTSGFGGQVFVDAFFATMSAGFFSTGGRWEMSEENNLAETFTPFGEGEGSTVSFTGLELSLMGRVPLVITDAFTLAPMFGIAYRMVLTATSIMNDDDGTPLIFENPSDFNSFWLRFGLGMDFTVNAGTFLRGTLTYGVRFRNDFERHAISDGASGRIGHGFDAMFGIGFR